jgi:hypothetical protein
MPAIQICPFGLMARNLRFVIVFAKQNEALWIGAFGNFVRHTDVLWSGRRITRFTDQAQDPGFTRQLNNFNNQVSP